MFREASEVKSFWGSEQCGLKRKKYLKDVALEVGDSLTQKNVQYEVALSCYSFKSFHKSSFIVLKTIQKYKFVPDLHFSAPGPFAPSVSVFPSLRYLGRWRTPYLTFQCHLYLLLTRTTSPAPQTS